MYNVRVQHSASVVVCAQFLRKVSTQLRETASIQCNFLQRRHRSRAKEILAIVLEQANGGVNLSVDRGFRKVVPGNVPALELPRVDLIVPSPAAQAGDSQNFFTFC